MFIESDERQEAINTERQYKENKIPLGGIWPAEPKVVGHFAERPLKPYGFMKQLYELNIDLYTLVLGVALTKSPPPECMI